MSILDEFVRINIHKEEIKNFPKNIQTFINSNSCIEFYPNGLKKGKPFNKVVEFKRLIKEIDKIRKKNNGKESNEECIVYDMLQELFLKMMLSELRKLKLENIL